jgi:hypothetical protein
MESFEPLINLLIVLTVLSVAAERATNLLKLRHADLRVAVKEKPEEKRREERITFRSVFVGIFLAILVKADFFEILSNLDSPWQTLGWVQVSGSEWVRAPASAGAGTALYAILGSVVTGVALGFGSKFWHEVLDAVLELRGYAQRLREREASGQGTDATAPASQPQTGSDA